MKLSFFKAAHFFLVVMTTHLATHADPDASQYMKNPDLTKLITKIMGSVVNFDEWDFVKRFGEGGVAGIGYSDYVKTLKEEAQEARTPWDGNQITYDFNKPVTVLFGNKGGNTDNDFWFSVTCLIKDGKQFIVKLGRDATEPERLEAYIVEIAGYIEDIANNVKDGVDFPFNTRYQLIESLTKHITSLPSRANAENDKNATVNSETGALMVYLGQINTKLTGITNDFDAKKKDFENLLKEKIEASVSREISANIIEKKFLAVLKHFEQKGLMVIHQVGDSTTVTADDEDVAPILKFKGGITIGDGKAGAGRKGTAIWLRAERDLEIMHFLVKHGYAKYVRAMDIQSYISNTVDPRTQSNLEQWQRRVLIPQMRLPVTPNLTIVIGQFTPEHVEVAGQVFIQIISGLVLDKITAFNKANSNILKVTSVKNYTAYRVDIAEGAMKDFHEYETNYTAFLELIQGKVQPCPFSVTKGVCVGGVLTWEAKALAF